MRRTAIAVAIVIVWIALLLLYRWLYVEPRAWGAICAGAQQPLACAPRTALLWLQHYYRWGTGALVLGVWAFLGAPLAVRAGAVGIGVAAVINYNATWGMLGAALGVWSWFVGQE